MKSSYLEVDYLSTSLHQSIPKNIISNVPYLIFVRVRISG